jgi:dephospho-CoA kinase
MLRVGLTGSLGSGKSTVASMLRAMGAEVIEADVLGRAMMQPGERVYDEIVRAFGPQVVGPGGELDRKRLAELAFAGGRLDELNAIIHPAVIAAQRQWMDDLFVRNPAAVAVIESALIFEVVRDAMRRGDRHSVLADWRRRMDRVIVVTAPDDVKIARYAARSAATPEQRAAAEGDARRRLAHQIPDAEKAAQADFVLDNSGTVDELRAQVAVVWERLKVLSHGESNKFSPSRSVQ